MRKVFVSYSRNNIDIITKLIQDLQAVGIETWHDQTLTGGQRWWDNILANIRNSDIFIFALSPESWDSEACKSELSYVTQLGKPILPVLVSEGININLLSPPLNEIQVTDFKRGDKDAVFALVKAIYTAPTAPALPDPLPKPPQVPVSYLSNLKERIDSSEPLSSQHQITLIFELEGELREGRSPTEIRDLLLRLKRRDDLLAKIALKIDAALKDLEEKTVFQQNNTALKSNISTHPPHDKIAIDYSQSLEIKHCLKCGMPIETRLRFCAVCGVAAVSAKTSKPLVTHSLEGNDLMPDRAKSRHYTIAPEDTPQLIADIRDWLTLEGFESQQMTTETHSTVLQIKKRGGWREYAGMSTSLNIVFHQSNDKLSVDIGAGKWIDKAAIGTVSLFILWPLAITAGFGAWEQLKMPEKIFDRIENQLSKR